MFNPMHARARMSLLSLIAVAGVAALAAEPIRRRIFSSFGSGDAGSAARADALRMFPGRMSGHWGFGWGWARREFIDPAFAYQFNLPSNAPLIVLYRSGTIAFIAFAALAILGCVYAYRAVRSNSFPRAMYGGVFIGLCVVQMQLDHPLADTPTGALTYSIFLAFLVYIDRERLASLRQQKASPDAVPAPTEAFVAASR
jgi:polysaccharide biosynthesis protein PslJ